VTQENTPSWFIAFAGFAPAALVGIVTQLLVWRKFRIERGDKRDETDADHRDRVRVTMDAQSLAMWDRLEAENKRLAARLQDIEHDRDRGWDLARYWNGRAHSVKHQFANLLQRANYRLESAKLEPIQAPEIIWPGLEDPSPRSGVIDDEE
jgi:hypothetical protein